MNIIFRRVKSIVHNESYNVRYFKCQLPNIILALAIVLNYYLLLNARRLY